MCSTEKDHKIAKKPASAASKLKVFRTSIGFHDAYVATPTKKAALQAWGAKKDLFARGAAEQVTDPALIAEPLASPGVVVKRLRGTTAEQFAALPPEPSRPERKAAKPDAPDGKVKQKRPKKPVPKPSRAALDTAEQAIAKAEDRQSAALKELAKREAALAEERRKLITEHVAETERLAAQSDRERSAYDDAIRRWRG